MKSFFRLMLFVFAFLVLPVQSLASPVDSASNKHKLYEDSNEISLPNLQLSKLNLQNISPFSVPNIEAKSYILMDALTGMIIAEQNKDERRPPASMTKMMTAFIVLDQIKQKKISLDEEVVVSERAANGVDYADLLEANERMTVKDLMIALMVESANDASVALGEHVAGSEEAFIEMMNKKAQQLNMKNTHFNTTNGLSHEDYPDPPKSPGDQYMSAYDSAVLAKKLLTTHPSIFDFTTITHYTFRKGTKREKSVHNWNYMLPGFKHEYAGVDGVKTGSTKAAGYCLTGTVKQKGIRLISVVMGTESEDKRFTETAKLYDYVYKHFKTVTLHAGEAISKVKNMVIANAVDKKVSVVLKNDVNILMKKGEEHKYSYKVHQKQNLKAPLRKGQTVGTVEVLYNGKKVKSLQKIELVTKEKVEKINFLKQFWGEVVAG